MFITGLGIGLVMQVLVVAVQNAVGYQDLGVATSGNTLFRNIGASVGTAALGTIFASQLASRLAAALPNAPAGSLNTAHLDGKAVAKLPETIKSEVLGAFSGALDRAFLVAGCVSIVAFAASWFVTELPMRTTIAAEDLSDAFGLPRAPDSLVEVMRSLSVLIGRPQMRDWLQRVLTETGIDVPLVDCWVLVQLRRDPQLNLTELAARHGVQPEVLQGAAADLVTRGLLVAAEAERSLTPAGEELSSRLVAAVRARLSQLLDGWDPDHYADLAHTLDAFAQDFAPNRHELQAHATVGALTA